MAPCCWHDDMSMAASGGDFFPVNRDLSMVGIGLRSNMAACQQLMDQASG